MYKRGVSFVAQYINISLRINVPRDTVRYATYWTVVNKVKNQIVLGPNP